VINSFKYVCAQPTWHARLAPIGGSAPLSKPLTCSVHARPTTAAVTLTPPAGTQRQGERSGAAEGACSKRALGCCTLRQPGASQTLLGGRTRLADSLQRGAKARLPAPHASEVASAAAGIWPYGSSPSASGMKGLPIELPSRPPDWTDLGPRYSPCVSAVVHAVQAPTRAPCRPASRCAGARGGCGALTTSTPCPGCSSPSKSRRRASRW
jgi:hypothetical protein